MLFAFCIVFNGLVPRFALGENDRAVLCRIIASQSVLLDFFSFSVLSGKIVNNLFYDGAFPWQEHSRYPSDKNKNSKNSSSAYSILSFDKRSNSRMEYGSQGVSGGGNGRFALSVWNFEATRAMFKRQWYAKWRLIVYLLLMLMMYGLARSGIEEASAEKAILINGNKTPNLDSRLGVLFEKIMCVQLGQHRFTEYDL